MPPLRPMPTSEDYKQLAERCAELAADLTSAKHKIAARIKNKGRRVLAEGVSAGAIHLSRH
jgi:hypothetical protein